MSHLKSRFNKFVRDRSIKAHGRGHRRLSEPAAQRRQDVRSLGTGLPPVSSFPLAGASLLNIDFALVPGVDIKCGHCGSRAVCVTGNTARSKDRLGVVVLHRPMQPPIYACSAIQTCDDCKKTTRHDDPAVLAKLGPCDDMLLPCEHEQCVGTRQHRATREFVDLVSSATAFSDAGWETVSREHSEALAVRRSRNHLSRVLPRGLHGDARNESAETDGFAAAAVPAAPAPAAAAAPTVADGSEPSTTSEDCSGFLLAGP
ncbi:hypothetical protein JL720_12223 [Aureococcus anophagefferens]|nr:hypothetical protein JL720_12223 [Aureococcus anophagefferens]